MRHFQRFFSLFLLLALLCGVLFACKKPEEIDSDEVDPTDLARTTKISAVVTNGELPNVSFEFSLTDSYGLPVENMTLTLSSSAFESVSALTDKNGIAVFAPAAPAGIHEATVSFDGSVYYKESTLSVLLNAAARQNRSGVYVRVEQNNLNHVDLDALLKQNVGNVYLHQEVLSRISRIGIEEFIAKAKERGIQVHLWLICLWDKGDFVVPITEEKKYHQAYFDSEAEKVKNAASLEGLYGIHFDYIRFDGSKTRADKYKAKAGGGGETAVTEFVRQMTEAAHTVNEELVLSGTVMAEYNDLINRYGQDIKSLSHYLDYFVPMLYTGNYNKDAAWVTECMRMLRQNFPETDFRPALLSYVSDSNQQNKSTLLLSAEVDACYEGGANGVTLFHYNQNTTMVNLEPTRKEQ